MVEISYAYKKIKKFREREREREREKNINRILFRSEIGRRELQTL